MKWMIPVLLVLLAFDCSALSVEDRAHTFTHGDIIRVVSPLSSFVILEYDSNSSYVFEIKVTPRLSSLSSDFWTNSIISGTNVNVSNMSIIRLISNTSGLYKEFIDSLNLSVVVGRNSLDDYIMETFDIGLHDGFLKYEDKIGRYPFNSAIVSSNVTGKRTIFVYGNAIEGEVSALRYLKSHKDDFLYFDNSYYLDDIDSLSVYDYMHSIENQGWYNTDTSKFKSIVNKSLFGKVSERIIDVKTNDGVLLRVLEVVPLNSKKMNDFRNNVTLPLVFARGLWSNLYSWQGFGIEMADEGRLVYLIEITGGPGQDCSDCVNYNYSDLIESYWPALIGTVQRLNNNSKIQYVGHSNGARTGISSLEIYNEFGKPNSGFYFNNTDWVNVSMTPNPIDTYIAVGMPGAFEGEQGYLGKKLKEDGVDIIKDLNSKNKIHTGFWDIFDSYFGFTLSTNENSMISLNLFDNYVNWIELTNDSQPIVPNISRLIIITGNRFKTNDIIVTLADNDELFNQSLSNSTEQYYNYVMHTDMGENGHVQYIIKKRLNNKELNWLKKEQYYYKEK